MDKTMRISKQRARFKEEYFYKKVKEMFLEEEKQRMPIAQGIPWTTEYPEVDRSYPNNSEKLMLARQTGLTRGHEDDVEKIQQRDYSTLKDASLLRFFVDMRGADADDRQLRDDLMTILIMGHETTIAILTWSIFLLAQNPLKMRKAQAEVDSVLSEERLTVECIKKLEEVQEYT